MKFNHHCGRCGTLISKGWRVSSGWKKLPAITERRMRIRTIETDCPKCDSPNSVTEIKALDNSFIEINIDKAKNKNEKRTTKQ